MNEETNNGLILNNQYYLPAEILSLILTKVDVTTLSKHCTLVCKQWNGIIKENVWKLKCEQELMENDENKQKLRQLLRQKQYSYIVYQTIFIRNQSFYTNLIKNWDNLKFWKICRYSISVFSLEDINDNICKITDEMKLNNITKCWTPAIHLPMRKIQIIDLCKRTGLTQQFIDEYQPPIYVSDWYGNRRTEHVTSIYKLCVVLYDTDYNEIERCNCNFLFESIVEQGQGGFFRKAQHVFKNYGKNVRYVYFWHSAIDRIREWREDQSCCTKYAGANVQLFYPNDTRLDHVIDGNSQQKIHKNCRKEYCEVECISQIPEYFTNKKYLFCIHTGPD
ncbi:F-box only protein 44-like [Chrysoperla carnea]|uniref:F-box only protein 44-like n=1 Tax=Chrysoperla carnea TaxID=189513 RepID=UPI001D077636|nr:F-box only protein 44-like [Chrysoperla carnea]